MIRDSFDFCAFLLIRNGSLLRVDGPVSKVGDALLSINDSLLGVNASLISVEETLLKVARSFIIVEHSSLRVDGLLMSDSGPLTLEFYTSFFTVDAAVVFKSSMWLIRFTPGFFPTSKLPKCCSIPRNLAPFKVAQARVSDNVNVGK